VQEKPGLFAQGMKLRLEEAAEEAGQFASSSAGSSAARTEMGGRLRTGTDNSGSRVGTGAEVYASARRKRDHLIVLLR
jgi:hypothetical protein